MSMSPGVRYSLHIRKVDERLGYIVHRDNFLLGVYQTARLTQLLVCVVTVCQCVSNVSTPKALKFLANMWMFKDDSRPQPTKRTMPIKILDILLA